MKFIKKIFIVVLTFILFTFIYSNNTNAESSTEFYFNNLDIVIDVDEKGVFTVP